MNSHRLALAGCWLAVILARADAQVLKGIALAPGAHEIAFTDLERAFTVEQVVQRSLEIRVHGRSIPYAVGGTATAPSLVFATTGAARLPIFVRPRGGRAVDPEVAGPVLQQAATPRPLPVRPVPALDPSQGSLGADYVIVAADALMPELEPLIALRRREGLRVLCLSCAQVCDALAGGEPDWRAIQELMRIAAQRWRKPAPRFLLLAGGASSDGDGSEPWLVPCAMTETSLAGPTPTDEPFALVDGDALPDLAVGRLPAHSRDELRAMVARIVAYETTLPSGRWQSALAFVAGEGRFGAAADQVLEQLFVEAVDRDIPPAYDVRVTYASERSPYVFAPADFNAHVLSEIAAGPLIFTYVGHGARTAFDELRWQGRRYPVLRAQDLAGLEVESGAPVVIAIACSTGAFDDPRTPCIGEQLLRGRRAIAFLGASRASHPYPNALFGLALIEALFAADQPRLGEVIARAKRTLVDPAALDLRRLALDAVAKLLTAGSPVPLAQLREEELSLYNLLGDPALELRCPRGLPDLSVDRTPDGLVTVSAGLTDRAPAELIVECRREVIPWPLEDASAPAAMRRNHARANRKAICEASCLLGAQPVLLAPGPALAPGRYWLKVFATRGGELFAGARALTVPESP